MQNVGRVSRSGWYVLAVPSGGEQVAITGLSDLAKQGVEVEGYRPLRVVWVRVRAHEARKIKSFRKPVKRVRFVGYVFVRFNPVSVAMSDVKRAAGALSFVSSGGVLACVGQRFIDAMRSCEASGVWDVGNLAAERLAAKLGSSMLIKTGAMAGFIGVLKAVSLEGLSPSVEVEVQLFGQPARIQVDVSDELRVCGESDDWCLEPQ